MIVTDGSIWRYLRVNWFMIRDIAKVDDTKAFVCKGTFKKSFLLFIFCNVNWSVRSERSFHFELPWWKILWKHVQCKLKSVSGFLNQLILDTLQKTCNVQTINLWCSLYQSVKYFCVLVTWFIYGLLHFCSILIGKLFHPYVDPMFDLKCKWNALTVKINDVYGHDAGGVEFECFLGNTITVQFP